MSDNTNQEGTLVAADNTQGAPLVDPLLAAEAPALAKTIEVGAEAVDVLKGQKIQGILDSWFNQHIHNSPVSRSVESLHHVRERLGALREQLVKEL